jgi:hypothetical protein
MSETKETPQQESAPRPQVSPLPPHQAPPPDPVPPQAPAQAPSPAQEPAQEPQDEGRTILGKDPVNFEISMPQHPGETTVGHRVDPKPARGERDTAEPTARPSQGRQEAGPPRHPMLISQGLARPQAYDPRTVGPGGMHGTTHRLRQDSGLRETDIVEMTIRPGVPHGGWVDFAANEGLDELRVRLEPIGANSQGINLLAGHSEVCDLDLIRELRSSSIPSRLVRRGSEGGD